MKGHEGTQPEDMDGPGSPLSAGLGREDGERLVADFTVRIWQSGPHDAHVEVIGNHSGRSAREHTSIGVQWTFALLRALRKVGAYPMLDAAP